MVELDEGFFEAEVFGRVHSKLKRCNGNQRQDNVAVMAESVTLEDMETGKKNKSYRYFKMQV